jgi:hypothetical protein
VATRSGKVLGSFSGTAWFISIATYIILLHSSTSSGPRVANSRRTICMIGTKRYTRDLQIHEVTDMRHAELQIVFFHQLI